MNSYSQDTTKLIIPDTTDFSTMSLEDLIKLKSTYKSTELEKLINQSIEVASRKPLSLKKSPSIISVISSDEILKSGARDLIDVLNLVPGIQFNVDVSGSIGISIRGLWAQEGKVLILYDGQEMNEIDYGSLQFAQQYPINQIKKIEIIRGPGSASYGGFAEYAVINIITFSGDELNGLHINSTIGQTSTVMSQQNLNISYGRKIKDFNYSFSGFVSRGNRSNLKYTDIYGSSYDMSYNSGLSAVDLNLGVSYKGLSLRIIKNNLYLKQRDMFSEILSKAYNQNFISNSFELKYQKQLTNKFQLQIKGNYKNGLPWYTPKVMDSTSGYYDYRVYTERIKGSILGNWDINRVLNVTFGFESYIDNAKKLDNLKFRKDSTLSVQYVNYAPFIQTLIKTRFANITAGLRYDMNNSYGQSLNPRLGITKKIGKFNLKALLANSFRAPCIENIQGSLNGNIKPEKTHTYEFEVAYQFRRNMFFTLNVFEIETKNSIRYFYSFDSIANRVVEGYTNATSLNENVGLEFEYKYKSEKGYISLCYSYYDALNSSTALINNTSVIGNANHKLTLNSSLNLSNHFYISPSFSYLSERYGYSSLDSNGDGIISKYPSQFQLNINIGATELIKGLNINFGVYNLTNQRIQYIQTYSGYHNPLPGMGREFILKVSYLIHHKK